MFDSFIKDYFPLSEISNNKRSIALTANPTTLSDTRVEIECNEFLPKVYDTWSLIHQLSTYTIHFRGIYDYYRYEMLEINKDIILID